MRLIVWLHAEKRGGGGGEWLPPAFNSKINSIRLSKMEPVFQAPCVELQHESGAGLNEDTD